MKFSVELPTGRVAYGPEFVSGEAVAELSGAVEKAGFDGCYVTDHPFGDDKWLAQGGHHALDPLVSLAYAAASTRSLRLHTHILVLPYRNPFLAAKAALTLDVLSNGRVILGVGAGYLKSEFFALGVPFEERNELIEESLVAMKLAWTTDGVAFAGRHFNARGNTMLPRPTSKPHPPIWMGGNSKRAIRRAVDQCQGWTPFPTSSAITAARTASIDSIDLLAGRIDYLHEYAAQSGRTEPMDICFGSVLPAESNDSATHASRRQEVKALGDIGVTWVTVAVPGASRTDYLDHVRRFADEVIAPLR